MIGDQCAGGRRSLNDCEGRSGCGGGGLATVSVEPGVGGGFPQPEDAQPSSWREGSRRRESLESCRPASQPGQRSAPGQEWGDRTGGLGWKGPPLIQESSIRCTTVETEAEQAAKC